MATLVETWFSIHVTGLKDPEAEVEKVIMPVGVIGSPEPVSVTVTVQTASEFTMSGEGMQVIEVDVVPLMTERLSDPEPEACVESPA